MIGDTLRLRDDQALDGASRKVAKDAKGDEEEADLVNKCADGPDSSGNYLRQQEAPRLPSGDRQ